MRAFLRFARHALAVVLLTVATQIGGLAWLLALLVRRLFALQGRLKFLVLFVCIYASATLLTHQIAPLVGRVPLACFPAANASLAVAALLRAQSQLCQAGRRRSGRSAR